jgi:hypothetical protein
LNKLSESKGLTEEQERAITDLQRRLAGP